MRLSSLRGGLFAALVLVPACTVPSTHEDFDAFFPDVGLIDGGRDAGMDAGHDADRDADRDAWRAPDTGLGPSDAGRPCTPEICSNGLDDDCNGLVDDTCMCVPGDTMGCFHGAPEHRGLGQCADGHMVCTGLEFGSWGPCEGDVVEAQDVCDTAGLDEDCDGAPNDGCECDDGDPELPCGTDEGACVRGVQRCVGGMLTTCEGAVTAAPETCDDTDEDCDGRIDEALVGLCGSTTGNCTAGISTCTAGAFGPCVGGIGPGTESCDGTDEDCDGLTDEDSDRSCGTDVGQCRVGIEACASGALRACSGSTAPMMEMCNGLDDDCDGATDEGLVRACGSDTGECVAGTQRCTGGLWPVTCSGEVAPSAELCDGTRDENCDGAVDEGCGCTVGAMRSCGIDTGACNHGMQTCAAGGTWGACTGAIDPRPEVCDGTQDENCDGVVDEGCTCTTGATRACGTDTGECVAGLETCDATGRWGVCSGSTGPVAEACNMRDDDCDAAIDEMNVCPRLPPMVMCPAPHTTVAGTGVTLVGAGSDPDGGSVTYAWTVVVRPGGSSAMPSAPSSASTGFTPDAAGDYTLRFCVTDDEAVTTCCTTTVAATSSCSAPAVPTPTLCGTSWDRQPIVQFAPLPSGQVYELFVDGMPYGSVTSPGQNYYRPAHAVAPGGPFPAGARSTITVRACHAADPACCSATASLGVTMFEECTASHPPAAGDLVFSEYVINGDGGTCPGPTCETGEAFEVTNTTNCPISLDGDHFFYCTFSSPGVCNPATYRWMNFGPQDVVPPRGVYVAIRQRSQSMCVSEPPIGANNPGLFGLQVSTLDMQPLSMMMNGWFVNGSPGGMLRIATGAYAMSPSSGTTIDTVSYSTYPSMCASSGYDAVGACGDFNARSSLSTLAPNQLGRLWHPCDAVVSPNPAMCRP